MDTDGTYYTLAISMGKGEEVFRSNHDSYPTAYSRAMAIIRTFYPNHHTEKLKISGTFEEIDGLRVETISKTTANIVSPLDPNGTLAIIRKS